MDDLRCNSLKCRKSLSLEVGQVLSLSFVILELKFYSTFLLGLVSRNIINFRQISVITDMLSTFIELLLLLGPSNLSFRNLVYISNSNIYHPLSYSNSSHIFCIQCATSLFSQPQICPACETSLPEP